MSFQNQQNSSSGPFNPPLTNLSLPNQLSLTNVDPLQLQQEEQARTARQQEILNQILKLTQPTPTPPANSNTLFSTSNTSSLFPTNLLSLFSSVTPPPPVQTEANVQAPAVEIQIAQLLHQQQQQQLGIFTQTPQQINPLPNIQPSIPTPPSFPSFQQTSLQTASLIASLQQQLQNTSSQTTTTTPTPFIPSLWKPIGPDASKAANSKQESVSSGNLFVDRQVKKQVAWNLETLDLEQEKKDSDASSEDSNDGIDNTSYDYANYTQSSRSFGSKHRTASEGTVDTEAPRFDSKKSKVELVIQATATKTKRGMTQVEQPQPPKKQKVVAPPKEQENLPKKTNSLPNKVAKEPSIETKPVVEKKAAVEDKTTTPASEPASSGNGLTMSQIALAKQMAKHQKQLHTHIPDHYKAKKAIPNQTKAPTTTTAPAPAPKPAAPVSKPSIAASNQKPVVPPTAVPKVQAPSVQKNVMTKPNAPAVPKPALRETEIAQLSEILTPLYNLEDDVTKINLSMVTVPYQMRKLQLPSLFKLMCSKTTVAPQELFKQVRELEFTQVYAKSKNKDHYKALMLNLITKLKSGTLPTNSTPAPAAVPSVPAEAKAKPKPASKKLESDSDSSSSDSSSDSSSSDSEDNANDNNKKPKKVKPTSSAASDASSMRKKVRPLQLKPSAISEKFPATYYLLTKDQLIENDYPNIEVYNQNTLEMLREPELNSEDPHKCSRCSQPFQYKYNTNGNKKELIREDFCQYHSGKGRFKADASGSKVRVYSCCGCTMQESKGCCKGPHVFDYGTFANQVKAGIAYVQTRPNPSKQGMLAIDCEMCFTTGGFELIRVTVVNENYDVVYDKLVKPRNIIVDYNSQFSGITAADLDPVKTTLAEVQHDLLELIGQETILIGQSLNSDLKALRIIHHAVIDTSIIYPHPRGPPLKRSLKELASNYLQKFIQQKNSEEEGHGHDSYEDAAISMQLVQLKIASGPAFGKYQ